MNILTTLIVSAVSVYFTSFLCKEKVITPDDVLNFPKKCKDNVDKFIDSIKPKVSNLKKNKKY